MSPWPPIRFYFLCELDSVEQFRSECNRFGFRRSWRDSGWGTVIDSASDPGVTGTVYGLAGATEWATKRIAAGK